MRMLWGYQALLLTIENENLIDRDIEQRKHKIDSFTMKIKKLEDKSKKAQKQKTLFQKIKMNS